MEEKKDIIYHKLEAGKKYRVWKSTYQDRTFYKILFQQTNYDGTKEQFYLGVQFKKNVELKNETDIIIHCAYENFRKNHKDEYNWIPYYVITDFEIVERQEQIEQQAYDDFRNNLDEIEEIDESDLPF